MSDLRATASNGDVLLVVIQGKTEVVIKLTRDRVSRLMSELAEAYDRSLSQDRVRASLRAPVVEAETDGADPADVATWDEVLP